MKHKITLTILFLIIAFGQSYSQQIEIDVRVSPPFQLGLDGLTNQLLATVRNTNLEEPINDVNFRLELFGPKSLRIFSDRVFADDIDLAPGEVRSFMGGDWEDLYESINLTIQPDSEKQRIIDTQSLRDGVYKICLTAYSTVNLQNLSLGVPSDCDDFTVEVPDLPKIILPLADYEIPSNDAILQVNWYQNVIRTQPTYILEVVDATYFPRGTYAVDETFSRAESVFYEDDITSFSSVVDDVDWEEGHEYEIRVTSSFGENEGVLYDAKLHSRPVRVKFIGNAIVPDTFVPEPEEEPTPPTPEEPSPVEEVVTQVETVSPPITGETAEIAVNDTIYAGHNGEFLIELSKVSGTKAGYDGEGVVFIDWLMAKVKVSFEKITLTENKHLRSGTILAAISQNPPIYPKDWAVGAVSNIPWTNNLAGEIVTWVKETTGQEIPYNNLSEIPEPIEMPLGISFDEDNRLVLTEMIFDKDKSIFNIIGSKTTPLTWGEPETVGFIAKEIVFHPTRISTNPKRLELIADVNIEDPNLGTAYTFFAPTDVRSGCYAEWGDTGFSMFVIDLENELSRNWLLPLNDTGANRVKLNLKAQAQNWDNLLLTGNLEPSIIVGSGGIEIEAPDISYDMSDVLNVPNITFPTNYEGETSTQFRGFYAKTLKLKLPEAWETSSNGPLEIDVTNMIVDNMGVTMKADALNVADFNTTSVVDMAASIDSVHVEMIASSLIRASIKGKLALPITDVTEIKDDSKIDYSALLNIATPQEIAQNKESFFQLTLSPTKDQEIDFDLIDSKISLAETSSITATVSKTKKAFEADLSGEINIGDIEVGPLKLDSKEMSVEHLNFAYDSSLEDSFSFNKGEEKMALSFSSPQKYLESVSNEEGFSITFNEIGYEEKTKEDGEYLRGSLVLSSWVKLSDDLSGYGKIAITGAIDKNENNFTKFSPKYVNTALDSLSVSADVGAIAINGSVGIRENDPTYGDGFKGELQAQFKVPATTVTALAEFGKVDDYNYWSVQAGVTLPTPIPLAGAIAFKGFGGGTYYNMNAIPTSNINGDWSNRYQFTPKENSVGFNVKAQLVAPKEETFNSDVEISATMNTGEGGGIENIKFNGDLWVGSQIEERAKAPIKGSVEVDFDFVNSVFDLTADATVEMEAIKAKDVGLQMHADGSTGKWFFKFGDPYTPNIINIGVASLGVDIGAYFMFGNDIPIPNTFTNRFAQGYKDATGDYPDFDPTTEATSEGGNAQAGSGIALGLGFNFKVEEHFQIPLGYYAGVNGAAGAELNLSLLEYPYLRDNGYGYNGWQAGGSIGFYASVGAGVFTKNKRSNTYDKVFTLAEFSGGAYVIGNFPNPVWVTGGVSGRAKVLCAWDYCAIDMGVNIDFEYGEKIDPGQPDVTVIEAKADETTIQVKDVVLENIEKHIVEYIHPETSQSFSPTAPIAVKYNVIPNFNFEKMGEKGLRIFRFDTQVILQEKNPMLCSYENLYLYMTTNNIGERLYTADTKLSQLGDNIVLPNNDNNNLKALNSNIPISPNNSLTNNLAYGTNYKLSISTVLQEFKNGKWKKVELNGKIIQETVSYSFKTTESNIPNIETLECDRLYNKMTVLEYSQLSIAQRMSLRGDPSKVDFSSARYFISNDGKCECPRYDAEQKLQAFLNGEALEAQEASESILFNEMTNDQFNNQFGGSVGLGSNQTSLTQPTTLDVNNAFSPKKFNYSKINTTAEGSFGSINNMPVPAGF